MSTVVTLFVAMAGVVGTLLAPVLTQRTQARALKDDFDRQQQAARAQWQREQDQAELQHRRTCYVAANAAFRRYRVQLMNHLWNVHRGAVDDRVNQELEDARQAHHLAFAEAQMIASVPVLDHLDEVAMALSEGYRKTKDLEEGHPGPEGSFEEIEAYLRWLWERWKEMRNAMRADLGVRNDTDHPPHGEG